MKPFEIIKDVHWIGALHPDLRVFDIIMPTKNGTTYNSYLIKDEKNVIIDTVKEKFAEQYVEHIAALIDMKKIDYVIMQHNEPDHSGSLLALLAAAPQARVVCAKSAVKYVEKVTNAPVDILPVSNKEILPLGANSLQFFTTPFCHWPDTMMTYLVEQKMLFSSDIMGAHFCDSRMFDDLTTRDFWPDFKYYFDYIMRPFRKNVGNAIQKAKDLPVEIVAPSHGPILRTNVRKYIDAYEKWCRPLEANDPPKMLIYYASAYGYTGAMATKIAEGAESRGVEVDVFDATEIDVQEHLDLIEKADALLLGSPTINSHVVKPVWDVLNGLITIDVKGKIAASFGSYGWSGEAVEQLDGRLKAMRFKVPYDGLRAILAPNADELQACFDFGAALADSMRAVHE
ncbi:FprA family A-type flavoprotein [candidate division KSB1 bacterium]|nr:FprA family A-type flavoprotein [candidate division KSB1 bacterium]RQW01498.1 MAG: FprA family A-type flavoprotein [candidate division KSB1 bacterium]